MRQESFCKKAKAELIKEQEVYLTRVKQVSGLKDLIAHEFLTAFRRSSDEVPSVYYSTYGITFAFRLAKFDGKFIWTTTERIFDLLGARLDLASEYQNVGYFSVCSRYYNTGKCDIDVNFYFASECKPITREVTKLKTIGYACS